MALFKPARTYSDPANSQSGMATPGAGAQLTGAPLVEPGNRFRYAPEKPTKGFRSWFFPNNQAQAGQPDPLDASQRRPAGSMDAAAPIFGGVYQHETPYYDRGAAAFVPNFGKLLTNPIGAGVVALHRPQASYGPAAQYANGAIWWTSQVIPTSVNLQGLTDPAVMAAILSQLEVQAVVRTTG